MNILTLIVSYSSNPGNSIIYAIGRRGSFKILGTISDYPPYFYVFDSKKSIEKTVMERGLGEYIVRVEETDLTPLVFDESSMTYKQVGLPVSRVYARMPGDVKSLARIFPHQGASNIKYEARMSFDLVEGFMGTREALSLLPAEEIPVLIEDAVREIMDFKIMSFDLELASKGSFPRPGERILTVSYSTRRLGDVGRVEEYVGEVDIIEAHDNQEIIAEFNKAIEKEKPDIIVGYNSIDFDARHYYHAMGLKKEARNPPAYINLATMIIPHIDLYKMLVNLRNALKVKSTASNKLEEIALELGIIERGSRFYEIEKTVDRMNMLSLYEHNRSLFYEYARIDVALTQAIAQRWLPTLFILSILSKIPPTLLQAMNIGQVFEYTVLVYFLEKQGFVAEIRKRRLDYRKVSRRVAKLPPEYHVGKVIAREPGLYRNVLQLDFKQLYPTIFTTRGIDPLSIAPFTGQLEEHFPWLKKYSFPIVLGKTARKSHDELTIINVYLPVVSVYSIISPLLYNLYITRTHVKALKKKYKRVCREKGGEYCFLYEVYDKVDQGVKIMNNSSYGAMTKQRGNLLNEVTGAYVFYYGNKVLLETINYAEKRLGLKVIYGDTDSLFITPVEPSRVDRIVGELNGFVKKRFGELFELDVEGLWDIMVIPKKKTSSETARKTYLLFKDGRLEVAKGIFFKIEAPLIVKENLWEIYSLIVLEKYSPRKLLEWIMGKARSSPPYKLFYSKSRKPSDLINEEESRRRGRIILKNLNRLEHFILLYKLALLGFSEKTEDGYDTISLPSIPGDIVLDFLYLPIKTRGGKRFILYMGNNGDDVLLHDVSIAEFMKDDDNLSFKVKFAVKEKTIPQSRLLDLAGKFLEKTVEEITSYIPLTTLWEYI